MSNPLRLNPALLTGALLAGLLTVSGQDANPAGDWSSHSPREELRPVFSVDPRGGPNHAGSLIITHDAREGLDGWYQKSFPVAGGEYYRFGAVRKIDKVSLPRRSTLVRIVWGDAQGRIVPVDPGGTPEKEGRPVPSAEPEHPRDGATDDQGWTRVGGVFHAPPKAIRATVELHLQWAPGGRVEWSDVEFAKTEAPPSRKVRLATIHYMPKGRSPRENCEEYAPFIVEAAAKKADLVVLGETVPSVRSPKKPHEIAEAIPGPTTEYFGELARKHGLHIVVSLYERDAHLVYNSAVLLAPDGKLLGKYRKMCLPHAEVEKGIAPGKDYPVFDTAFGKVGMMICYDGFFPEVARELANRGAEVIAWPVWGCDPLLAQARACENRVTIVSSTFMDAKSDWMISAVFDPSGQTVAKADQWGSVAVVEVDLARSRVGPYNLGDFRSMVQRHRPER